MAVHYGEYIEIKNNYEKDSEMQLNRLQIHILEKICSDLDLEMDDYLIKFSMEYINRFVISIDDLTEAEGDAWITKAYLKSLG